LPKVFSIYINNYFFSIFWDILIAIYEFATTNLKSFWLKSCVQVENGNPVSAVACVCVCISGLGGGGGLQGRRNTHISL
jgi:hypothetical protein